MKSSYIIQRYFFLLLLIVSFFFLPETSMSGTDIPNDNIALPVLIVNEKGVTGSGFYYYKKGITYLITARHVLFDDIFIMRLPEIINIPTNLKHKLNIHKSNLKDEKGQIKKDFIFTLNGVLSKSESDELINTAPKSVHDAIKQLFTKSQKLELKSTELTVLSYEVNISNNEPVNIFKIHLLNNSSNRQVKYHPSQDVAFIRVSSDLEETTSKSFKAKNLEGVSPIKLKGSIARLTDNVKLFKDVIIGNQVFIFGYPTSITESNPLLDIKMPLLRKGIVAGKNEFLKAIILDCPVFYGNSGGLVIEVEKTLTETRYNAIGLISQFAPYSTEWFQNSGYSIVVPMDFVDELIASQTE